jgi:hypothetical protein
VKPDRIRVLARGIIWRGEEMLLMQGYDPTKRQTFCRPLGGGVERGEQAPRRRDPRDCRGTGRRTGQHPLAGNAGKHLHLLWPA